MAGAEDHYVPVHQLPDQIATLTHVRSLTARLFTRAEQAQNHVQVGNMGLAFRTIIDWMTGLGPIERAADRLTTASRWPPWRCRKVQYCSLMLHAWDNFFILAGGAAATLMGLLFVAVTVGGTGFSESRIVHGTRGFLTPTLVQFGTVLLQALAVLVPWPSAWPIGILFGLGGLTGLAYQANVVVKRHKFGLALHDWHDWLPYVGVPALGSACLVVGAVGLIVDKSFAPYAVAGATTLLLFGGVYGAWDLTLWIIKNRDKAERSDDPPNRGNSTP